METRYGFALGFAVLKDRDVAASMSWEGCYTWVGGSYTMFWVDPKEELIGIFMTQVSPYTHLTVREEFKVLAYQAIID